MAKKRAKREQRADDQGRLADEKATGQGPQAEKRPRGRPRKNPLPDPAAPKRKPGRPRKNQPPIAPPPELTGPPAVEPDAVELEPGPCDDTGRPLSLLWDTMRARYPRDVRLEVENLMRGGSLELDDLVWLELAEHADMGKMVATATERFQERLITTRLQSRKQVMRIIVERGPVGGVNARNVRVPEGLELENLTRPADEGDDVLAEPVIEDLPERYRDAARASITPAPK